MSANFLIRLTPDHKRLLDKNKNNHGEPKIFQLSRIARIDREEGYKTSHVHSLVKVHESP